MRCDALHEADEIWLYLSGGGLRATLGSYGLVFFLHEAGRHTDGCIVGKVRRIGSVSGGSVANAGLATWSIDDEDGLRAGFDRAARHGGIRHYLRSVLVASLVVGVLGVLTWGAFQPDLSVPADSLVVAAFAVLGFAGFQIVLGAYLADRIRYIVGPAGTDGVRSDRLHVFATTDLRSGLPAHVVVAPDGRGTTETLLVHDRTMVSNRLEFHRAPDMTPSRAACASATWPALGLPVIERPHPVPSAELTALSYRPHGRLTAASDARAVFALMDGGLTGTLASRLDSRLDGWADDGVMQRIEWPVGSHGGGIAVHRIVVDGGRYLGVTPSWWLALVPGVSALTTVGRSIKVSLDGQLTAARRLADDRIATSYVEVTGHGRHRRVRFERRTDGRDPEAPRGEDSRASWSYVHHAGDDELVDVVVPDAVGWFGHRSTRRRPSRPQLPVVDDIDVELEPAERFSLALLDALKLRADRLSYLNPSRHATACAASAIASAYVEAHGVRRSSDELVALVRSFERAMRRTGDLDEVIWPLERAVFGRERPRYRWPALERLVPGEVPAVVPISHRGLRTAAAADNSVDAFVRAVDAGFRVLECDVALTAPSPEAPTGELVAVHPVLGRVRKRGTLRFVRVEALTLDELGAAIGRRPDRIVDLLGDRRLAGVVWNFEAKSARCMERLVDVVAAAGCTERIILSGGWLRSSIDAARARVPDVMTAGHLVEKMLLAAGRPVPHLAVVQLPAWLPIVAHQAAQHAARQGVQVHWFGPGSRWRARRHARSASPTAVGVMADSGRGVEDWLVRPSSASA